MPFADEGGLVAVLFEKFGDGEETVVDWSADGGAAVGVGETDAFVGNAVDPGGWEFGIGIVGTGVTVALVIAHDEEDVGLAGLFGSGGGM